MSPAAPWPLRFTVGARTLWSVRRRLVRLSLSLDEAVAGSAPALAPLDDGDDGYLVTSLPTAQLDALVARRPELIPLVRQRYARRYAALAGGRDAYLAGFSAKSRSTLRRKTKRLAERSGGALDIRMYRTAAEITQFHDLALGLSRRTYQARLLGNGLPEGDAASAEMRALAAADRVRGWLLFVDGAPAAYLYTPADGDTLIYAHLGYDPALADLSPGTVLQFAAMQAVAAEGRFARFDFTEGDGQHKRLFATAAVDCADLLLLRPTLANRALIAALRGFDRTVALAKTIRKNTRSR